MLQLPEWFEEDGLVLRPPTDAHATWITQICQDPEIQRFTRVPVPYARDDAESFVAMASASLEQGGGAHLLVERAGNVVGCVGASIEASDQLAEVGYWTAPAARRQGIAARAMHRLCQSLTFGHIRQLDKLSEAMLTRAWAAGAGPGAAPMTIDLDSTVCEVHGYAKQGAGSAIRVVDFVNPSWASLVDVVNRGRGIHMTRLQSSPPVATGATSPLGAELGENVSDVKWTRWMLWGNVVGAGAMAVSTLIAPTVTASLLDLDADPLLWRLVGSMWLGFAVASGVGLRRPARYRGIMVAQIVYKSAFVALAVPAAVSNPGLGVLVAAFVVLVAGYGYALWTASDRSE